MRFFGPGPRFRGSRALPGPPEALCYTSPTSCSRSPAPFPRARGAFAGAGRAAPSGGNGHVRLDFQHASLVDAALAHCHRIQRARGCPALLRAGNRPPRHFRTARHKYCSCVPFGAVLELCGQRFNLPSRAPRPRYEGDRVPALRGAFGWLPAEWRCARKTSLPRFLSTPGGRAC